jgi:hypothetical protein
MILRPTLYLLAVVDVHFVLREHVGPAWLIAAT